MRNYRCEHWSMNDIAHAMKGVDNDERRIVIPIYQRGKRWEADKREKFINSLLQGFPVGTLLFAEQGHKTYAVIDGLQRSTTICEYILYPTRRDNLHNIEENVLANCREVLLPGKGFDIPIQEIERKYSFTAESDFEFLDYSYENGDNNKLETEYLKFLERRFAEQKKRFFNFLGIE